MILAFGGLTVLARIKEVLPNEDYIYYGDTLHFPYGPKTKEEIIKYSRKNTEFLIEKGAKVVVIACGTATSQAMDVLQKEYKVPIIGVIEPVVDYIKTLDLKSVRSYCNYRNNKKWSLGKSTKNGNT